MNTNANTTTATAATTTAATARAAPASLAASARFRTFALTFSTFGPVVYCAVPVLQLALVHLSSGHQSPGVGI